MGRPLRAFLVVSTAVITLPTGCGYATDCADSQTCAPTPAEAGVDGSTEAGVSEGGDVLVGGCDPNADPKVKSDCVDDAYGLFVAPAGNDASSGTKATPLRTIGGALAKSAAMKLPRIYVCGGAYAEACDDRRRAHRQRVRRVLLRGMGLYG